MLSEPTTILLTGGTSGIGLALLHHLHGLGHKLAAVARSPQTLESLREDNCRVSTYACDLSEPVSIESTFARIKSDHPDLSMLINNAAVQHRPHLLAPDFDGEGIAREVAVNFTAPVKLSHLCLKHFAASRRATAIVNISSGLAFYPKTGAAVYCASKAALHSFSQSLRYQLEGTPVSVIEAILPLVNTPMTAGRGDGRKITAMEAADQIVRGIRRGRQEIYVGKARMIPIVARLAPSLLRTMLRRSG